MNKFLLLLKHELYIAWRVKTSFLHPLSFFFIVMLIFPFAITSEEISKLAPLFILISMIFANLLQVSNIFTNDHQDGTLEQLITHNISPSLIIMVKITNNWLITSIPIIIVMPIIAILYNLPDILFLIIWISLIAFSVSILSCLAAVLTINNLKNNAYLTNILIFPFIIPIIIYSVASFQISVSYIKILLGIILILLPLILLLGGYLLKNN